eukprot:jgi/Botrbrau1/15297/Bobra.0371s0006.1
MTADHNHKKSYRGSSRPVESGKWAPLDAIVLLLCLQLRWSEACTVFHFEPGGFAKSLTDLYITFPFFNGTNGPFYIDSRSFPFACTQIDGLNMGWHEFFQACWALSYLPFIGPSHTCIGPSHTS